MKENCKATKYCDVIPNDESFSGEKFREVLKLHGITITDIGENIRRIKIDAHGERPDMYINVPKGHVLDRYLFYDGHSIPIDTRLQYLNRVLLNSGYIGENITMDMLNSDEKFSLASGEIAEIELCNYKKNKEHRQVSDSFFFNNPDGEKEREKFAEAKAREKFVVNFEGRKKKLSLNSQNKINTGNKNCETKSRDSIRVTAEIGGKTINLNITQEMQRKMMAVDSSHRLKLLDKLLKKENCFSASLSEKTNLINTIDNKLFSKPSVFVSSMTDNKSFPSANSLSIDKGTAAVMSAANYDSISIKQADSSLALSQNSNAIKP